MLKNFPEILLVAAFLVLLFISVDPLGLFMPDELEMIFICVFAAAFGIYAGLLFRERPEDEREAHHLHIAGRGAYLGGIAVLSTGIIVQTFLHQKDPWLVLALGAMVIIKLVLLIIARVRY